MKCPNCSAAMRSVEMEAVPVHRCDSCGGTWCDADELRLLKDKESRGDYRWIDVDLWKDAEKLRAGQQRGLACPKDGKTLITVSYDNAPAAVDICATCRGAWLDKGDFDRIVAFLDHEVNAATVSDYLDDIKDELVEVITGPEHAFSELRDLSKVLYLLQLRFGAEHGRLADAFRRLARGIPGA